MLLIQTMMLVAGILPCHHPVSSHQPTATGASVTVCGVIVRVPQEGYRRRTWSRWGPGWTHKHHGHDHQHPTSPLWRAVWIVETKKQKQKHSEAVGHLFPLLYRFRSRHQRNGCCCCCFFFCYLCCCCCCCCRQLNSDGLVYWVFHLARWWWYSGQLCGVNGRSLQQTTSLHAEQEVILTNKYLYLTLQ